MGWLREGLWWAQLEHPWMVSPCWYPQQPPAPSLSTWGEWGPAERCWLDPTLVGVMGIPPPRTALTLSYPSSDMSQGHDDHGHPWPCSRWAKVPVPSSSESPPSPNPLLTAFLTRGGLTSVPPQKQDCAFVGTCLPTSSILFFFFFSPSPFSFLLSKPKRSLVAPSPGARPPPLPFSLLADLGSPHQPPRSGPEQTPAGRVNQRSCMLMTAAARLTLLR